MSDIITLPPYTIPFIDLERIYSEAWHPIYPVPGFDELYERYYDYAILKDIELKNKSIEEGVRPAFLGMLDERQFFLLLVERRLLFHKEDKVYNLPKEKIW